MPAGERGELLHGVAAWLTAHTAELAQLLTQEGGKPYVENRDEVGWTASAFNYYAELGRHERGRVIPSVEEGQLRSGRSTAPGIPDDMAGSASGRGCETIPPRLIVGG